jgi:hypothetical protein
MPHLLRLDHRSAMPLHTQAGQLLRDLIRRPEYQSGALLPDEVALAARLGISRGTVRLAIGHARPVTACRVGHWCLAKFLAGNGAQRHLRGKLPARICADCVRAGGSGGAIKPCAPESKQQMNSNQKHPTRLKFLLWPPDFSRV